MDPITLGAHALYEELRLLLSEPPPGCAAKAAARVSVTGTQITDLLKALQHYEAQDANTRPFVLLAFDVTDERDFLGRASVQLQASEKSIRACLSRAGVPVDAVELPPGPLTIPSMAAFLERLSRVLAPRLGGVVVGFLPARIEDEALRDRIAEALVQVAAHPRLVVLLPEEGSARLRGLVPHEIAFRVDEKALWKFLREGRGRRHAGPPRDDERKMSPEHRRQLEQRTGRRVVSEENRLALRSLLLDAGEAFSQGRLEVAARAFRKARTYCQMLGLEVERATCAVAVGTARLALGQKPLALRAYEEARDIAAQAGATSVVVQAELGIAATHLSSRAFERARAAYERCGAAAAAHPAMEIECLRMCGHTFAAEGRPGDAVETWLGALASVEALPAAVRAGTAYKSICSHLIEALPAIGRAHEALSVKARSMAIDDAVVEATREALERAATEEAQ